MKRLTLTILLSAAVIPHPAFPAESKPNVIVILCDNLGYGDVGCFNPKASQPTPRIDRMAQQGMKFTHAYAAAPVCTPSRAALMTGCYPRRVGLDLAPGQRPVLKPVSAYGLHPDEITVAEVLKQQGYATLCIGKWHLGDQSEFLPTRQGFDEYFGIPYSDNMTTDPKRNFPTLPLMEGEKVIAADDDLSLFTRRGTERALKFIEQHRSGPFFLYFPQVTPGSTTHPPVSPAFRGKSGNDAWGDSVVELDWSTGQILDKLDALGLGENTLVIWTSDNGAPFAGKGIGSNLPLKGDAYSVAEGGMRMPFIARWPGRIRAGAVSAEVITLMDLLPTLAALSGGTRPADRIIDGHDIRPLLFGEAGARSPYDAFFYYYVTQLQAVRSGPWKLYLPNKGAFTQFGARTAPAEGHLYNLTDDPGEKDDQFTRQPEVVKRLLAHAEAARADLGEADRPGKSVRPVGKVEHPTPRLLKP
ncbi:MAG: sulfatase [Limisphaerales bacterium]